jgi:hypothetical protein
MQNIITQIREQALAGEPDAAMSEQNKDAAQGEEINTGGNSALYLVVDTSQRK